VAAGAGVGVGSAADEAVARRAVRAAVPTTSRKATTQKAAPKPAPTTAKKTAEKKAASAYYKNCAAVQAAGAAPIHRGDPGYGSHLDRDGDGKGCAGD
jgi:hypothetical protein